MTSFIDAHRRDFGVEPICRALEVAPSTYYAAKGRGWSRREFDDVALTEEIVKV
jgi:putative transposase